MSIPTQTEMFGIVLGVMSDGQERGWADTAELAAERAGLTVDEKLELTASGVKVYKSRSDWGLTHLFRAGLLDRVSRGVYRINDEGKSLLEKVGSGAEVYHETTRLIKERNPWSSAADKKKSEEEETPALQADEDKSPKERIDDLVSEVNESLGSELLSMILDQTPDFFEKLVVDLIEKMGYGKGKVTKHSNDAGIDGMVSTDELGFRPIYTQAKRYAPGNKVGRPEIQAFMGALGSTTSGIFITTSSFTSEAVAAAAAYPHATIVLIDGARLVDLMIKYNLGVFTERVIELKRIDSDYFEN